MREKKGNKRHLKQKKTLTLAKGYRMSRSTLIRSASSAVLHAGEYAFHGRKLKKRNFRTLWIKRLNAALSQLGVSYRLFINSLKKSNIILDRKILAQIAVEMPDTFKSIVEKATK